MSTVPVYPGWNLDHSPFHAGELAVQQRVGVKNKIDAQGRRAVRRYLTEQHREFFPLLPYAFVGSIDGEGRPWASMLMAEPGFLRTLDPNTLVVKGLPFAAGMFVQALADRAASSD